MNSSHVFSLAPFYLCHYYLTGLHPWAADMCCAVAGGLVSGLDNLRVLHVGAGFGADLFASALADAKSSKGIEASLEQVEFNAFLRRVQSPAEIERVLLVDPVTSILYERADLENVALSAFQDFRDESIVPGDIDLAHGNVLTKSGPYSWIGMKFNAVILNISVHWLVKEAGSVNEVFRILENRVAPGGVVVASLPQHLVDNVSADRREKCLHNSPQYKSFADELLKRLKLDFPDRQMSGQAFDPVPGLAIDIDDLSFGQGKGGLVHVATHTRFYQPREYRVINVLKGLGMFESMAMTGQSGHQVVSTVARASASLPWAFTLPRFGTYVYFFAFRKPE